MNDPAGNSLIKLKTIQHMRAIYWMTVCCLLLSSLSSGQTPGKISLVDELTPLYNIAGLPGYREHSRVLQVSTYDSTGGNNDGFSGTYSFIKRNEDSSLVIFDVKGAGVINRIWTPTPTEDTLDFYIDDPPGPSFSIKYTDLFSNKVFPFLSPLAGSELGGYYCYFPILFQHGCRIVCRGKKMQFHQVQYRAYPDGAVGKSFSLSLNDTEKVAIQRIAALWNKKNIIRDAAKGRMAVTNVVLHPGETKTVFAAGSGGRIVAIKLNPAAAFAGIDKDIDIRVTWDDETVPAVWCPVADFFGYAFGQTSMNSLLLGTQQDENYCYFPMPYDKKAKIELIYRKAFRWQLPVHCSATIIYTPEKREVNKEGKFYSCWRANQLSADDPMHVFLRARGKGHYVGTLLQAQGLKPGMTNFFEGDDSTATDDVPCIHGTGSEDYFNGGWYACPNRWDGRMSLPIHGALDYSLPLCRTGGYRFYLSDKVPFEKSIFQSIEHGPDAKGDPVQYTSVSFYYCDRGPGLVQPPTNERCAIYIPDTLMIYPQLMQYTVWGSVNLQAVNTSFHTGGRSYIYSANDQSRLKIDLSRIPAGDYRLFADLVKFPIGCLFSVCQGQTGITGWIDTHADKNERVEEMYIADLRVDDAHGSLTFNFSTRQEINSLFLNRLILVKKR